MARLNPAVCEHFVDLLGRRAEEAPDRLALRFLLDGDAQEQTYSYAELDRAVRALAAQLQERAKPGERALLLYPNGPDYVIAMLACFYAGVVAVPAYPLTSSHRHQVQRVVRMAADAQPACLMTTVGYADSLRAVRDESPELRDTPIWATDEVDERCEDLFRMPSIASDGLALLQYTSGSTGVPKGVMVAHDNLMGNEAAIRLAFEMVEDDVVVSWLPVFHDMGLVGTLLQPLYSGVPGVLLAPQHFLMRPGRWLRAISRFKGTVGGAPNFAYRLCTERLSEERIARLELDLSGWRLAFCGAEPIQASTLRSFANHFAGVGFDAKALYPCYGLAEATLLVTGGRRGDGMTARCCSVEALREHRVAPAEPGDQVEVVCCGQVQPEHEVRILEPESGAEQPSGRVGEICFAGPSVTKGYFGRDSTQDTFVTRDSRRWLHTGDLGFVDDGRLYVTGRLRDVLIVRGRNLYPQDIESAVESLDMLRTGRVAAFGVDGLEGEGIGLAAEVEPRMLRFIDLEAVAQTVCEVVAQASGETARAVYLVRMGALPITSSGKLQRRACARGCASGELEMLLTYYAT